MIRVEVTSSRLAAVRVMGGGSNFPNFPNFPSTKPRAECVPCGGAREVQPRGRVNFLNFLNFRGTSESTRRLAVYRSTPQLLDPKMEDQ